MLLCWRDVLLPEGEHVTEKVVRSSTMMRVVIVEDEGITRKWIKKKIEDLGMGFVVEGVFSNGSQALEYMNSHDTDVVFTDIQMPVMDGLELLEQIQAMEKQPYKVILSAYDEFCYARRAMKLGAQEFVLKPEITEESLRSILEEARKFQDQRNTLDQERLKSEGESWEASMRQLIRRAGDPDDIELIRQLEEQGIFLSFPDMILVDIFFDGVIRKKLALELLNLFLEKEQTKGTAFSCSEQEFVIFYAYEDHENSLKQVQKLRKVLKSHMGVEVYLGVSRRKQDCGWGKMYRQASMACENRRFFSIPGCQSYESMRITAEGNPSEFCFFQNIKQIGVFLGQRQYTEAQIAVERLLEAVGEAVYLYPAYVKTMCNEFLVLYLHEIWKYDLTEEEKGGTGAVELLFEQAASHFHLLKEDVLKAVSYMTQLLKRKSGINGCSAPVQEIIKYIEEHYAERISLAQISDSIYLSQSYASTLFKKETGKKFSSYLQEVRLEKSCEMLLDSRISIQEIAVRTGFFDAAHFSRVFKEWYGLSPAEYRKRIILQKGNRIIQ